jgi:hypothetical protein
MGSNDENNTSNNTELFLAGNTIIKELSPKDIIRLCAVCTQEILVYIIAEYISYERSFNDPRNQSLLDLIFKLIFDF